MNRNEKTSILTGIFFTTKKAHQYRGLMNLKFIKLQVIKQTKTELKKKFSKWHLLKRKEKKELVKKVTERVLKEHGENTVLPPTESLLGIEEQTDFRGIINLKQMGELVSTIKGSYLFQSKQNAHTKSYIEDKELQLVNELLDNDVLEQLLYYPGYSKNMGKLSPVNYFRAEILKSLKYPEISYRKFCDKKYLGRSQKENREFIGLSLREKGIITHSRLSQFRSGLTFAQIMNLLVYVLFLFQEEGLMTDCLIHEVDSTELPNTNRFPLHTIEVNGKKVKIYSDLDCDCGKRRGKRDKSQFFVGYRMHTLVGIHPQTGANFPLVSMISAGNHHDSHFMAPLIKLGQAMGIEIQMITADEAYHDKSGEIYKDTGVNLITPASEKVKSPKHVDPQTGNVMLDEMCEIPMQRLGNTDEGHEYKCNAEPGECSRCSICPKYRLIPFDSGVFQRVPITDELAQRALDIRKNAERAFNLLKHREGLETVRVRSQHSLIAQSTFATIATLLIEIMGTRKKKKQVKNDQLDMLGIAA